MIIALLGILAVVSACPAKQYYNASLADCAPCDPSCSACSALFRCSECQSGYYLQAEACWPCQTACKTCVRTEYCTSCDSGFYFANASSTCQLCSSNCLLCTPNDCLKCNPGFYPEGSACLTCKVSCECSDGTLRNCPDSFGGTSLLVAIILAPILAVITIALLFCLRKKICKQEETREIPTEASEQSLSHGLKLIGALLIMQNSSWKLNSQGKAKGLEETCSICLHGEVDLLTTCNHSFHAKCLRVWLLNNRSCPMCKRPCAKQMRKYCKQCKHNYILCTASSLAKFCTSIFAVCAYCQRTIEPTQTQTDT